MFDFKESIVALIQKLHEDLNRSKECEGSSKFIETVKDLSNNFYDYFHCVSRSSDARGLVDIQAEIELSEKNLKDYENLSNNLFNVVFTLRALGSEIDKMKLSLELLYKEVDEFWNALKVIESQNFKIVKILTELWKVLTNLKKELYVLNSHQKQFIENNLKIESISFSDYISCSPNEQLNSILKSLGNSSINFSETVRQMKYLNYLLFNHQKLKSVHCLFSFQLIMLINNPMVDQTKSKQFASKISKVIPKVCHRKKPLNDVYDNNYETVFNSLERQALDIGRNIHNTTREVREVHCASIRREAILLSDIQVRKLTIFRRINELQNIIAAYSVMEDSNNALVGKLVKTRPLFDHIKEYLKLDLQEITEKPK